jgi:hypothetical protein
MVWAKRGDAVRPRARPSVKLATSLPDKNSCPEKFEVSKSNVTVPVTLVQLLALQRPEKLVKGWPTYSYVVAATGETTRIKSAASRYRIPNPPN